MPKLTLKIHEFTRFRMTTSIDTQKYITVDDVKERIASFDFRRWVWMIFSDERNINGISDGSEIYQRVFEPVLFDTKALQRSQFLEYIGYFKLMKARRKQEMSEHPANEEELTRLREENAQITRDIMGLIKEKLKPLYVGNFEYGAPVPSPDYQPLDISPSTVSQVFKWRLQIRSEFKKALKECNLTFEDAYKIIQESTGEKNVALAKEISLQHITRAVENRKQQLHQRRTDVSRVIMRADLPSDLVPLVCAYAVPESKSYDYM